MLCGAACAYSVLTAAANLSMLATLSPIAISMTSETTTRTIFYSWQSDLPNATNRQLIKKQLRLAINAAEEKHSGLSITLDEATRDTSGSQNVPLTILEKIRKADYFICDVSTINKSAAPSDRRVPNPNVIFELGYAVAMLGWGRIILLVNEEFGPLSDLPFDIDRQRASGYKASEPVTKNQKDSLLSLLSVAVDTLISLAPDKPGAEKSPEQLRRSRDLAALRRVISTLDLNVLDVHMQWAPRVLTSDTVDMYESFSGVLAASSFHLHDAAAHELLIQFEEEFAETVRYWQVYRPAPDGSRYFFSNPGDASLSPDQEIVWQKIEVALDRMRLLLPKLLSHVRHEYVEIDI
ncbi:hypothetical protein FEO90_19100 [Stenotrophomonas maltophilia]|nr:hypothetical protein FEO90_19100 [Stenotrophomonas maltophilia]